MIKRLFFTIVLAAVLFGVWVVWRTSWPAAIESAPAVADTAAQITQGRYLAQVGDCFACHTVRGGMPYAGGRAIPTAFGTFYSPNITPDRSTGLGDWTADDFWRALHFGQSRDGHRLYPAFPYPNYTKISRVDADALFAYLQSLPAAHAPSPAHTLRFPYDQRALVRVWQAFYFVPGVYQAHADHDAVWNRGAYLVEGLGHCEACHTGRNALGANDVHARLAGGFIPVQNWYAPSLTAGREAGLGKWDAQDIAALLKTGVSPRGAVFGPMSEVVYDSLQFLSDEDAKAMAVYLKALPQTPEHVEIDAVAVSPEAIRMSVVRGAKLYQHDCLDCHQARGEGVANAYPPLVGNPTVLSQSAVNPIRMVLNGGFPPATPGNPRPYGMPPFGQIYGDQEVADVLTYMRQAWGNRALAVSPQAVAQYRSAPLE